MSEHKATIHWRRETADFKYETYNRDHDWDFDGGATVSRFSRAGLPGERGVRRSGRGVHCERFELPHADLPGYRVKTEVCR